MYNIYFIINKYYIIRLLYVYFVLYANECANNIDHTKCAFIILATGYRLSEHCLPICMCNQSVLCCCCTYIILFAKAISLPFFYAMDLARK